MLKSSYKYTYNIFIDVLYDLKLWDGTDTYEYIFKINQGVISGS